MEKEAMEDNSQEKKVQQKDERDISLWEILRALPLILFILALVAAIPIWLITKFALSWWWLPLFILAEIIEFGIICIIL